VIALEVLIEPVAKPKVSDVKIRAVMGGGFPFVVLDTGERVLVGGRVAGMVLKAIDGGVPVFEAPPA
jgi:hypothetical protein